VQVVKAHFKMLYILALVLITGRMKNLAGIQSQAEILTQYLLETNQMHYHRVSPLGDTCQPLDKTKHHYVTALQFQKDPTSEFMSEAGYLDFYQSNQMNAETTLTL
jgi:hypothetical protein